MHARGRAEFLSQKLHNPRSLVPLVYYQSSQLCPHAPSSMASKLPYLDFPQVSDPFSPLNIGRQKKRLNLCCIIIIQYSQRMQAHAVTVIVECPANTKRGTSDNQGILQSLNGSFRFKVCTVPSSPSKLPATFCRPMQFTVTTEGKVNSKPFRQKCRWVSRIEALWSSRDHPSGVGWDITQTSLSAM